MIRPYCHVRRCGSAAGVVLVLVLLELAIVPTSAQVANDRPPPSPAQNLNPLSTLDPGTLDAFKGRPLFAPSRRPPPPRQVFTAPPAPVAVEAPPPDLRLVGVVAGVDKAVAILRRPTGGSSLSLKLGDSVETWRVQAIGPDRVTLRDGTRETTYRLFSVGASSPPGVRPGGPPPIGIQPGR
ncbi:hypothetical protein FV222_02065 [Methylobacterium sp. WL103]|uniref:hypothetical protein n=1 Tax=Methylobacterium sp. WL103 TaxID=2603891 RepID=UPI0011DC1569|nr:hypothetical protein [Methylobacterium sp. WL103]TXM69577.1 hypothetical protein FV226_18305 [Methylobacterium sp. WL12]TXN07564.1 hypothetical protein FV222_02065 [Methylobacterium sp. WL103]